MCLKVGGAGNCRIAFAQQHQHEPDECVAFLSDNKRSLILFLQFGWCPYYKHF